MKKMVILIIAISIVSMLIIKYEKTSNETKTVVYQIDNGFGYSIFYKQNILIKQDFIPAIQKQMAFCSKEDALLVAEIVKEKIKNNLSPSISLQDIRDHNIQTNCNK